MNNKQSKNAEPGFLDIFTPQQIAVTAVVVVLLTIAVVSGVKAMAPSSPPISATDLAAHEAAKAASPSMGYTPGASSAVAPSATGQSKYH